MNVCVFGAGAVGGYLAARLMASEVARVSVVTRGDHLTAIQQRGLCLREGGCEKVVRPRVATATASDLSPQDIVFVTLKASQHAQAANAIASAIAPGGHAVFVGNGIPWWWHHGMHGEGGPLRLLDPDGRIWRGIAPERTLGCVAYSANDVSAPGVVEHRGNNRWILGEPANVATPRLDATVELLRAAGLHAEPSVDLRHHVWAKLLRNAPLNSLCGLTRLPIDGLAGDSELMAVFNAVVDEVIAIAGAQGWDVTREGRIARQSPALGGVVGGGPGARGVRPSMLQDALAGRPMEVEAILGQPQVFAREAGYPTPAIDLILPLLRGLDRGVRDASRR